MKSRLGQLGAALILALSTIAIAAVPATATCNTDNRTVLVARSADDLNVPGTYFTKSQSTWTVRTLDETVCGNMGFTAVLGVNLESGGNAYQLGQIRDNGPDRFTYAYFSTTALNWPGSWSPISGHTYRFEIAKGIHFGTAYNANAVVYTIYDQTNSPTIWQRVVEPAIDWTEVDLAWWGGEIGTTDDEIGVDFGETPLILHHMSYQTDAQSQVVFRSGMTTVADVHSTAFPWNHGHITNWVYGGDGLQLEHH